MARAGSRARGCAIGGPCVLVLGLFEFRVPKRVVLGAFGKVSRTLGEPSSFPLQIVQHRSWRVLLAGTHRWKPPDSTRPSGNWRGHARQPRRFFGRPQGTVAGTNSGQKAVKLAVKLLARSELSSGAGEGNRTLVISLEGCCSTIELHPPTLTLRKLGGRSPPPSDSPTEAPKSATVGGRGRTRTYEGVSQRIYSPPPLPLGTLSQTVASH
jgi:hypothetical protein